MPEATLLEAYERSAVDEFLNIVEQGASRGGKGCTSDGSFADRISQGEALAMLSH